MLQKPGPNTRCFTAGHAKFQVEHRQLTDFARNDDELKLLRFVFASGVMGRPFMVGPRVPADRVAALRKAFDDMVKDEEVIAEFRAKKQELTPIAGNVLQKLVDELYATPPALIARVANAAKQ